MTISIRKSKTIYLYAFFIFITLSLSNCQPTAEWSFVGIEINKDHLFVTDFENSRILIYDLKGKLLNSINKHLDHPTDLVIDRDTMYVINHGSASISVFERD